MPARSTADNYGSGPGGKLVLQADSKITLSNNANVHALARAGGSGGDIILRTSPGGAISVDNSTVEVGSTASGDGGALSDSHRSAHSDQRGGANSDARASGNGGPITITQAAVLLDGGCAR